MAVIINMVVHLMGIIVSMLGCASNFLNNKYFCTDKALQFPNQVRLDSSFLSLVNLIGLMAVM